MSAEQSPQLGHKAKPGDLIKIYHGMYQHWVVYIGDDEVVGLPGPIKESGDGEIPSFIDGIAEVKRENIWSVIGKHRCKIYNLWDEKNKPREVAVIVKEARERVGQKLKYSWSTYNSEHFAKELRYGRKEVTQVLQSAVAFSQSPKRVHDAEPGDLIEIFRTMYQHWAVYIGEDEIVGLTSPNEGDGVFGNLIEGEALVKRENMWDVIGDDEFRVNNLWDDDYEPREVAVIIKETLEMVGQKQNYNLFSHNCEHFATERRYGKSESWQVQRALIGMAIVGALGLVVGGIAYGVFQSTEDTKGKKKEVAE